MIKNKKIIFVIGSLERGGAELHLFNILPILKIRYQWEPIIYCFGHEGTLSEKFFEQGIEVIAPPISADGRKHNFLFRLFRINAALLKLWMYLLFSRNSIIHFFLPLSYLLGLPIALLSGNTCLVMSRRCLNHYQNKVFGVRNIESLYHKVTGVLLGNSNAVINDLHEEGAPYNKTRMLYNGIEQRKLSKSNILLKKQYNIPEESLIYVIVANLIPYKGHRFLLKSLSLISHTLPRDWRLLVVGEDRGILNALKKYCQELKLTDNIIWLGSLDNPFPLLSTSDIGISSSSEEGFSNSILESMSAGLPMVVTDVGGNAEAVIHNETGLVVPYGDEIAMSQALLKLAEDKNLRVKMGEKGRERIEEHFTLEKCVEKYHLLYTAIANNEKLPDLDTPKEYLGQ